MVLVLFQQWFLGAMRSWQRLNVGACLAVGLAIALFWSAQANSAMAQTLTGQAAVAESAALSTAPPDREISSGESLFSLNCAGCHAHGGNIIRRGKNLKQKTLVRRGYGEAGAITQIITQGKGAMPAYADRLTGEEIEAIATYVLQQAESGW